jgi:multiple sugar transport system ATP-binding protein
MSMTPEIRETAATAAEVQLLNVCKTLGGRIIIDNLSLSVWVAMSSWSFWDRLAAEKRRCSEWIAGLEPLDAGAIWIEGRRVDRLAPGERRIAMVFQHYALYPHMTVRENMIRSA